MEEGLAFQIGTRPKIFNTEDPGDHRVNQDLCAISLEWLLETSPLTPLPVNQVSGAIVSSAMHVHSVLGPGLLDSAYQGCLAHELRKRGFDVASQVGLPVVFDGEKIEFGYRIDLVVENLVIVEVKVLRRSIPFTRRSSCHICG